MTAEMLERQKARAITFVQLYSELTEGWRERVKELEGKTAELKRKDTDNEK